MRRQARGRSPDDPTCLLDGVHLVTMAVDLGVTLDAVLIDEVSASDEVAALGRRLARMHAPTTCGSAAALDAASPVRSPSPVVALARLEPAALARIVAGSSPMRIVVVAGVQDPGNLGAIIRTADAGGAAAVVCVGACADPFGWKALRGSMGSTLRLPVCVEPTTERAIATLKRAGVHLVALDASAPTALPEARWPPRVALVVGREGGGLDDLMRERADALVRIPMRDGVESLNVAVATGIALYAAQQAGR